MQRMKAEHEAAHGPFSEKSDFGLEHHATLNPNPKPQNAQPLDPKSLKREPPET